MEHKALIRPVKSNTSGRTSVLMGPPELDLSKNDKPKRTVGDWVQTSLNFISGLANNAANVLTGGTTAPTGAVTGAGYTAPEDENKKTIWYLLGGLALVVVVILLSKGKGAATPAS